MEGDGGQDGNHERRAVPTGVSLSLRKTSKKCIRTRKTSTYSPHCSWRMACAMPWCVRGVATLPSYTTSTRQRTSAACPSPTSEVPAFKHSASRKPPNSPSSYVSLRERHCSTLHRPWRRPSTNTYPWWWCRQTGQEDGLTNSTGRPSRRRALSSPL